MATEATQEDVEYLGDPLSLELSLLQNITNNFSEERIIGSGGFGIVYKGVIEGGYFIAVKKLHSFHTIKDEPFEREVDCLMRIKHPNIVSFVGYCAETRASVVPLAEGKVFADTKDRLLCFEFLPNGSLRQHLTEVGPCELEWHICYQIIKGISKGLKYLHLVGDIIHRDLKPENILLDDDMVPKIADFGLSRLLEGKGYLDTETPAAGTRGYMAPEYIHGGKITIKCDIYNLGVIIREIVTGRDREASTENVLESWMRRLEQDSSSGIYRQIKACIEISEKCREDEPENRPTAEQILCQLEQTEIGDCSVVTVATPRVSQLSELMRRLKLMAKCPSQHSYIRGEGSKALLSAPSPEVVVSDAGNTKPAYKISWLDTRKCYMLSSRSLHIVWGDDPRYWEWTTCPDSRFAECAELLGVCYLAVTGEVSTEDLSPGTRYAVYLVYKLGRGTYGLEGTQTSSIRVYGERRAVATSKVSVLEAKEEHGIGRVAYPVTRRDGWMELKLAELATRNGEALLGERAVIVDFRKTTDHWKGGLIIKGMEFRPI